MSKHTFKIGDLTHLVINGRPLEEKVVVLGFVQNGSITTQDDSDFLSVVSAERSLIGTQLVVHYSMLTLAL